MPRSPLNLLRLMTAALIAAVIVAAGTVAYLSGGLPPDTAGVEQFPAAAFEFRLGSGAPAGDRMIIDAFSDGYALLSSGPVKLSATHYRFLRLRLDREENAEVPTLFWRRGQTPDALNQLDITDTGTVLIDLSATPDWSGEIVEFGFLFREAGTEAATLIGPVTFEPDSLIERLHLTWTGWTALEVWSQKSVNFLHGGKPVQPVRLPVLLVFWIAVTLVGFWTLERLYGSPDCRRLLLGAAVVYAVAWTVLDLRWTVNSVRQSAHTLEKYRGASEDQKLALGLDRHIYRFVSRLKTNVLPDKPTRILITASENALDYYLLRSKYHLLPHSTYVSRTLPATLDASSLDYLIYFGSAHELESMDRWAEHWAPYVRLVDQEEDAVVFQLNADTMRDTPKP